MADTEYPDILVISSPITIAQLIELAATRFGDMVKAVVDTERRLLALGGELHSDEEAVVLQQGSLQRDLWGINIYPGQPRAEWIEFDSVINIRPSQRNRSRYVEDPATRQQIIEIVHSLIA